MPPVVAAAVVAGVGAFIAKGTILAAAIAFGSTLVLGLVSRAMAPKPPKATSMGGRLETIRQPAVPRQVVYGRTRKGGVFAYIGTTQKNNRHLQMVIALAGHRVEQIGAVYFNGEKAFEADGTPTELVGTSGSSRAIVFKRLGADDQTAVTVAEFDAMVAAHMAAQGDERARRPEEWSNQHRLRGVAYIWVVLDFKGGKFEGGIPNVTADIRGRNEIFDPRTQATGYSENPALCVADYMANDRFGLGIPIGAADGIDEDDLIEAANICDEQLLTGIQGENEVRYACNGTFALDGEPQDIIESLLTAMAGRAAWRGGKWHIIAGAYREPVAALGEAEARSGGFTLATRVSRAENFNCVRGKFVTPTNDWQPDDFPPYKAAAAIEEDGEEVWTDIELPFTISPWCAQRLAKIHVMRARMQQTVQMRAQLIGYQAPAGETVALSRAQWGWQDKPFEVRGLTLRLDEGEGEQGPALVTDLLLRETSPLVFDFEASELEIYEAAPRSNLPSAFQAPAPTGIVLESGPEHLYMRGDGTVFSRLYVRWDDPEGTVIQTRLQTSRAGGPWERGPIVDGETTDSYILDVQDGASYRVRARHQNAIGALSEWSVSAPHSVIGKLAPPADVDGFEARLTAVGVRLRWDAVPDLDLRHYVVRRGQDWGDATVVARVEATVLDVEVEAAGWQHFLIRARDTSGNLSVGAAAASVEVTAPGQPAVAGHFDGPDLVLTWSAAAGSFPIREFELRRGASWATAAVVQRSAGNSVRLRADWAGPETWWLAAVDRGGLTGPPGNVEMTVELPAVTSITPLVIDNNVLLRWASEAGSLPIDHYELRRDRPANPGFAGAEVIGTADTTFDMVMELFAGTKTYWIAPVDSAGNVGLVRSISLVVDAPPGFILRNRYLTDWIGGVESGQLLRLPAPAEAPLRGSASERVGLDLDGVDDFVQVADAAPLRLTGGGTIEGWMLLRSVPGDRATIAAKSSGSLAQDGYVFWANSAGQLVFRTDADDGNTNSGGAAVAFGRWHHVAVAFDAGGRAIFVDGEEVTTVGAERDALPPDEDPVLRWGISGVLSEGLDGLLDELRIWDHARSEGQIQALKDVRLAGDEAGLVGYWRLSERDEDVAEDQAGGDFDGVIVGARWHLPQIAALAPFPASESVEDRETVHGYATPAEQVADGYPFVAQPVPVEAVFEEVYDAGAVVPTTRIIVTPDAAELAPGSALAVQISSRESHGEAWTDHAPGLEAVAHNFRYVKVRATVTSDGAGFQRLNQLESLLRVKSKIDSGLTQVGANPTTVQLQLDFIDVRSITATPRGTAPRVVVVDFDDVPFPTEFDLHLFDAAGDPVTGLVAWQVEGV